jgi:hypothetical protein
MKIEKTVNVSMNVAISLAIWKMWIGCFNIPILSGKHNTVCFGEFNSYNSLCSRCALQVNGYGNHQTSFPDCRGPCLCSISYWGFRLEPEVNDEEIERTDRQKDTSAVKPLTSRPIVVCSDPIDA